ncbi:hypothetical protein COOONC_15827 [Cooperia oncophora]
MDNSVLVTLIHGTILRRSLRKLKHSEEEILFPLASDQVLVWCAANRELSVLVCGEGPFSWGCGTEDVTRPTLLDELLRVHISELVCGAEHCMALTEEGEIYVWGNGEDGRLGTGKSEWVITPAKSSVIEGIKITSCRAGINASALLTEDGRLLAMGNNQYNKLNLAHRQGFFSRDFFARERNDKFPDILVPTMLKAFPVRVVDVHLGEFHTGVLLESGELYFMGRNTNFELGFGHSQSNAFCGLRPVKKLLTKACSKVACGDGFSLVGTADSELYFWGRKNPHKVLKPKEEATSRHILPRGKSAPVLLQEDRKDEERTWLKEELEEAEVIQISKSQQKLVELQKRQAELRKNEPPPAYVPKAPLIFSDVKSRTCTIL